MIVIAPVAAALATLALAAAGDTKQRASNPPSPESRAIDYLAREMPRWSRDNKCFSCHNNGDAARALYTAARIGYSLPQRALEDTSRWLAKPQQWDHNGGDTGVNDRGLARIQFAAALADALDAGQVKDSQALSRAAELVSEYQDKDGSWKVDVNGNVGSPATYGAALATFQARHFLKRADKYRYRAAIAKAGDWLLQTEVKSVLDAAAVLLALEDQPARKAADKRRVCLELIQKGQSSDGGWGPYVSSSPEPFDTAVVLLSLIPLSDHADIKARIQRGRAYLISRQETDGSWQETTRPPGSESYAQRISTTGWATLALLATRPGDGTSRR